MPFNSRAIHISRHSRLVPEANTTAFFKKCMGDAPLVAADAEMVRRHCLSTRVRVLKTIRFAKAIAPSRASLTSLAASPGYVVHVVHVLRHPYKVLVSQYNLGWYDVVRPSPTCSLAMQRHGSRDCSVMRASCADTSHRGIHAWCDDVFLYL